MIETIAFESKNYLIRSIELPKLGEVIIATSELNSVLLVDSSMYKSEIARIIDEQIYFYVELEEIYSSDKEIVELLNKIVC